MIALLKRLAGDERVRFLATGGFNTAMGYLLFVALNFFLGHWIGYLGSVLGAHLVASIIAFVIYRRFVFRVRGQVVLDFVRFQGVYVVPLLINLLALPVLIEILGWNVYLAQAAVMATSVLLTYLGHKFFSFRRPGEVAAEEGDVPARTPATWRASLRGEAPVYLGSLALTAVLTTLALALWRADWRVPFAYVADAIGTQVQVKGTLANGWYEYQPLLNAPHGQTLHDFSTADHTGLFLMKLLQVFTSDYAILVNVYYVLTFLLAALAAVWFLRLLGVSKVLTVALSALYALAPYHFVRGETHLWLSGYYCVPLAAGLVYLALRGKPLWGIARDRSGWAALLTGSGSRTLFITALTATTATYYGIFAIALLALAGGIHWVATWDWRKLVGAAVAALAVVGFMVLNMLPDLIYGWVQGSNPEALVRPPGGTEVYSLKFASLVLPVPGHRFGLFAQIRDYYELLFPIPGESPALGFVAAFGFVVLLGLAIYYATGLRRRTADATDTVGRLRSLSALTLCAFLLATVGGLASIFGLVVTSLRGWNRMSILIAILALAAVGILLDAFIRRMSVRFAVIARTPRVLAAGLAVLLIGVGYLDQVTPTATPDYASAKAAYADDQSLVDGIAGAVGGEAMILQLPYREYPESASSTGIADTDQLKFMLHSNSLRWSSGGVKGRPDAEWVRILAKSPTSEIVVAAAAAGFAGILVDRDAFEAPIDPEAETPDVVTELRRLLGEPVVTGSGARYQFFGLGPAAERAGELFTEAEQSEIGSAVVDPVIARVEPANLGALGGLDLLKPFAPRIVVDSARDEPVDVEVRLTTGYLLGPATLRFSYPDGTVVDARVGTTPRTITIPLAAAPGRSVVTISLVSGTSWPTRVSPVFQNPGVEVVDMRLSDLLARAESAADD